MSREHEIPQGSNEVLCKRREFLFNVVSSLSLGFSALALSACSQTKPEPLESGIDSVRGIRLSDESRGLFSSVDRLFNDPESAFSMHIKDASESLEMRRVQHFTHLLFEFLKRDERFIRHQQKDASLIQNKKRLQGASLDTVKKRFQEMLPDFSFSLSQFSPFKGAEIPFRGRLEREILIYQGTNIFSFYFEQFPEYFEEIKPGGTANLNRFQKDALKSNPQSFYKLKEKVLFTLFLLKNVLGRPVHRTDVESGNAIFDYRTIAIGRSLFQFLLKNAVEAEGQVVIYGRDFFDGFFASSDAFIQDVATQLGERIQIIESRLPGNLPEIYQGSKDFLQALSRLTSSHGIANIQEGIGRWVNRLTTTTPSDVEKEGTEDEKVVKNTMLKLLHDIDTHRLLKPSEKEELRVILVIALVGAVASNEKLLSSVKTIFRTILTSFVPLPPL